jgi:subtilisin family serine protease
MIHMRRPNLRKWRPVMLPLLVALIAPGIPLSATKGPQARYDRLDTYLIGAADAPTSGAQRVIIRTRPGARDDVRRALSDQGATILAEHESLEALTAVVPAGDLARLTERTDVLSISTDAIVSAHGGQLLGGLLGGVGDLLGGVVTGLLTGLTGVVTGVLDPATSTQGTEVSPKALRDTLGISGTLSGRHVGVAVIDSGLEMSSEFQGRVNAFIDFTDGKTQSVSYSNYSDAFGHGTHVAGIIGGSGARSYNNQY